VQESLQSTGAARRRSPGWQRARHCLAASFRRVPILALHILCFARFLGECSASKVRNRCLIFCSDFQSTSLPFLFGGTYLLILLLVRFFTLLYYLLRSFDLCHAFMGKYDAASVAAERLNFLDMRIVWVIFVVCVGSGSGACFHYQSLSHTLISSSWGIS